jgi:hypothetical protein
MDYAYFDKSQGTVNWLYTALLIFMGGFWFVIFFSLILILCSMQELFLKGKYLEEYMVLNMKMGIGKVGRIEN